MGYSYRQFIEDLQIGREFQFVYNGQKYFIGWGAGEKRMFCRSQDTVIKVVSNSIEELLKQVRLDGKFLKEIWGSIEVTTIF